MSLFIYKWRLFFIFISVLIFFQFVNFESSLKDFENEVYKVEIEGVIDLGLAPLIKRTINDAEKKQVKAIIFHINTFGGRLDAAVQIRDAILNAKILTVAFIDKRAISAGALISLACSKIIMTDGGTIGAATPVELVPTGESKPTSEKVVSYFRNEMKATAEKTKRPVNLAEAMVDPDVEIKGIIEKGKLLTLTTKEAIKHKLSDFTAENIEEVLQKLEIKDYKITEVKINWAEIIARFLTHPIVSSLLMSLGFIGLLLELKSPGFGLTGVFGITCLILFFFGHYVVNLVGIEDILLFIIGAGLLIAEIVVIPGFGLAGILGILFIISSLVLSLIDTKIPLTFPDFSKAITEVGASILATLIFVIILFKYFPRCKIANRLVLATGLGRGGAAKAINKGDVVLEDNLEISIIGKEGVTKSILRPSGIVLIDNKRYDAVTEGDYIDKNQRVVITKMVGTSIVVKKIKAI